MTWHCDYHDIVHKHWLLILTFIIIKVLAGASTHSLLGNDKADRANVSTVNRNENHGWSDRWHLWVTSRKNELKSTVDSSFYSPILRMDSAWCHCFSLPRSLLDLSRRYWALAFDDIIFIQTHIRYVIISALWSMIFIFLIWIELKVSLQTWMHSLGISTSLLSWGKFELGWLHVFSGHWLVRHYLSSLIPRSIGCWLLPLGSQCLGRIHCFILDALVWPSDVDSCFDAQCVIVQVTYYFTSVPSYRHWPQCLVTPLLISWFTEKIY